MFILLLILYCIKNKYTNKSLIIITIVIMVFYLLYELIVLNEKIEKFRIEQENENDYEIMEKYIDYKIINGNNPAFLVFNYLMNTTSIFTY